MTTASVRGVAVAAVALVLGTLISPGLALAQGSSGKIQGRVVDASTGAPIAAAQVEVIGSNRGNITNDEGYYFINEVPAGLRDVQALSIGYRPVVVNDQRVLAGQTLTLNFQLEATAVEVEALVVEGERNPLVPRDQVSSKAIVTGETIDELPLDNVESIIALQPGVVSANCVQPDGTTGSCSTIRGSRPNEEATYVDGVLVRRFQSGDASPLDLPTNALAQVDVTTGGFSARYSDAQSGVVNYTTRTGGEDFTGAVSYYTDELAPDDWTTGLHRAEASVGGPIFGGLNFFVAGTAQGRKYTALPQGTDVYVQTGIDTTFTMPTSDGLDSVSVAFPTFAEFGRSVNPFDQNDAYNVVGKLSYPLGGGSNIDLSYYRNRTQRVARNFGLIGTSELYNPQGWDGTLNTSNVLTLGGYFVLLQTPTQALALDVKGSYQRFWQQFGKIDPSWIADHSDPALGFNFSQIDFLLDPDDFELSEDLLLATRSGAIPAESLQAFPNRLDLSNRQTVPGVEDALRLNPYGIRTGLPIFGYGNAATSGGATGLEFREETDWVLTASLDWQAGRYNRVFFGVDYADIHAERMRVPLFDGTMVPSINDPTRAGVFLQDRLDLGDIVLEGGLRMDYFDPGGEFPRIPGFVFNVPDSLRGDAYVLDPISGPGDTRTLLERLEPVVDCNGATVCRNNFVEAETKTAWSPRLAVSFPVTTASTFRLSYGHNVQVPALQEQSFGGVAAAAGTTAIFADVYSDLQGGLANTNARFGRDVELPRTVLFEAGYRQLFGEDLVVDVAAYSKTLRNGLTYRKLPFADPNSGKTVYINVLTNSDYGLTRGIDLRVDKRFGELADLSLNYSFVDARGTGSDPFTYTQLLLRGSSNLALRQGTPVEPPEVMFPLEQSRTHNFSGTLSVLFPEEWGEGYEGVLGDVGVFATFSAASGLPFTRLENAGGGQIGPPTFAGGSGEIAEAINASRTPWTKSLDLRVHKGFQLAGLRMRAFADWRNPLDLENTTTVFLETGTPRNEVFREVFLGDFLIDSQLDSDTDIDDFYVGDCLTTRAMCEVPDDQPLINAYSLQAAEERWGNGDGLFTVEEQREAFGGYYDLFNGEQWFRQSDQSLRLGLEVVF